MGKYSKEMACASCMRIVNELPRSKLRGLYNRPLCHYVTSPLSGETKHKRCKNPP